MADQDTPVEETAAETVETTAEETGTAKEEAAETATQEGVAGVDNLPKKKSAQDRIDEITRARREAEREAAYWRRVALDKEKATPTPTREQATEPIAGLPPRPKLDQFDTTEAYEDALLDWSDRKRDAINTAARRREEQEKALKNFNKTAEKLRQEHEDFDEAINAPVFSPTMSLILTKSENGPLVAYHLGRPENRDDADRIRELPPEDQIYEIAKLEQQLLLAQKTKKIPGAPPPIKPSGSGGTGSTIDESKLSDDEWFILERKRKLEKLEARYKGG